VNPTPYERALRRAIAAAGGPGALAAEISRRWPKTSLTLQAISQWKRCPAERVLQVEAISGVDRAKLRPDLYRIARAA